jgi:NADH:ubiquinone oxidoreductase subunit 6 (subunit J)
LIAALSSWQGFNTSRPGLDTSAEAEIGRIADLGRLLVEPDGYAIPFEVASVLLIGALIGAIYLANEQRR